MSYRRIPYENLPFDDPQQMQEYMFRLIANINSALSLVNDFTPTGIMPDKVENGMVRYFDQAILPNITQPGPWMYVEGTWRFMVV
jgi:hypothetical protein